MSTIGTVAVLVAQILKYVIYISDKYKIWLERNTDAQNLANSNNFTTEVEFQEERCGSRT